MRLPSVRAIEEGLRVSRGDAKQIREALEKSQIDYRDRYNVPVRYERRIEEALEAISKIVVGFYGVEAINGDWRGHFWQNTVAIYCNAGDTYAATILYDTRSDAFAITTYGDFVERNERRYHIE